LDSKATSDSGLSAKLEHSLVTLFPVLEIQALTATDGIRDWMFEYNTDPSLALRALEPKAQTIEIRFRCDELHVDIHDFDLGCKH